MGRFRSIWKYQRGRQTRIDVSRWPNRVSMLHKGGHPPICNSGCRSSIAGTKPSSAIQLPITAALYAENLTLFALILHHPKGKVKPFFHDSPFLSKFVSKQVRSAVRILPQSPPFGADSPSKRGGQGVCLLRWRRIACGHCPPNFPKFPLGKPKQMCYDMV